MLIYLDDHEPAHVHVFGDGETKIALADPRIVRRVRVSARESRRALSLVRERQHDLLQRWDKING